MLRMKKIGSTRQMKENGRNLVDEVKEYCEDVVQCRRRMLLTHFDDETRLTPDTTRQERTIVTLPICCDNCNFPPRPLPAAGEDKDKGKAGKLFRKTFPEQKRGKQKGRKEKNGRTADEATATTVEWRLLVGDGKGGRRVLRCLLVRRSGRGRASH